MIKEVLVSYSKDNKALISTYLLVVIVGIIASFVLIPKFTSDLMNSIYEQKIKTISMLTKIILLMLYSLLFLSFLLISKEDG